MCRAAVRVDGVLEEGTSLSRLALIQPHLAAIISVKSAMKLISLFIKLLALSAARSTK